MNDILAAEGGAEELESLSDNMFTTTPTATPTTPPPTSEIHIGRNEEVRQMEDEEEHPPEEEEQETPQQQQRRHRRKFRFWQRVQKLQKETGPINSAITATTSNVMKTKYRISKKEDPYNNMAEKSSPNLIRAASAALVKPLEDFRDEHQQVNEEEVFLESETVALNIPSLLECRKLLTNQEADRWYKTRGTLQHILSNAVFNIAACLVIYFANTMNIESLIMITNAVMASWFYITTSENSTLDGAKLDFSFLAFSIVFPLTFLIQSTFARRDAALTKLADLKATLLATSLFTFTVDWPSSSTKSSSSSSLVGGRNDLPDDFNDQVLKDFQEIVQLVYEYLSMPNVSHARHVVIWSKQHAAKRVYSLQNDIYKRLQVLMFDLSMHTEIMRQYGFPSGEASRLHQYHQYIQQRIEQVRIQKYYRTPQATRSFGRAYILILPWLCGPYFVWVADQTSSITFALCLSGFTFLVLIGLLNAQHSLEDPYVDEFQVLTPGIDNIKLEFELATVLQSIEQYYSNAEIKLRYELQASKQRNGDNNDDPNQ